MRKLKLQMQMSVDGFVAGSNGELDWMTWEWDKKLEKRVDALTDSVDTILLGRKMTDGFISHWTNVLKNPDDYSYSFAKKMVAAPKVVFSRTLSLSEWDNTKVASDLSYVNKLKHEDGKGIIVYGGAEFVSSLVKNDLIDEYYLFINPAAIGNGLRIFSSVNEKFKLHLTESKQFDCGIVLNIYEPVRN